MTITNTIYHPILGSVVGEQIQSKELTMEMSQNMLETANDGDSIRYIQICDFYKILLPMTIYAIDCLEKKTRHGLSTIVNYPKINNYIENFYNSNVNKNYSTFTLVFWDEAKLFSPLDQIKLTKYVDDYENTIKCRDTIPELQIPYYDENEEQNFYFANVYKYKDLPILLYNDAKNIETDEMKQINYNKDYPKRTIYPTITKTNKLNLDSLPWFLKLHCPKINKNINLDTTIPVNAIGYIWSYAYVNNLTTLCKECSLYINQNSIPIDMESMPILHKNTPVEFCDILLKEIQSIEIPTISYCNLIKLTILTNNNKLTKETLINLYSKMIVTHKSYYLNYIKYYLPNINSLYNILYPYIIEDDKDNYTNKTALYYEEEYIELMDLTDTISHLQHNNKQNKIDIAKINDIMPNKQPPSIKLITHSPQSIFNSVLSTDDEELILFLTFVNTPDPYNSYIHPDYKSLFLI